MVAYDYDGNDFVMSVTSDLAKWKNASWQPKVDLNSSPRAGVTYRVRNGRGCVARPRTRRGHKARSCPHEPPFEGDASELQRELDEANRVILRLTPECALVND